jgi:hypothetical protein
MLYKKTYPVVKRQWVHIDYMRNEKDIHFNRILEACDFHGIADLLQFCYNWNQEVIAEFYSTLFFDKKREDLYEDDQWQEIQCEAYSVFSYSWIVFSAGHSQETSLWESDDARGDDSDVHPEQRFLGSQGG